ANAHWRNNLILGENSAPPIFSVSTYTNYSSSDYNGFRVNPGAEFSFQWASPPWQVPADYRALLGGGGGDGEGGGGGRGGRGGAARGTEGGLEVRRFKTLEEYSAATHQDQHSVPVDYDVFVKVTALDARNLRTVQKLYAAADLDFSLRPGSAAIDRGVVLANVTDGFTGQAPDLGALERGLAPPHYGPRFCGARLSSRRRHEMHATRFDERQAPAVPSDAGDGITGWRARWRRPMRPLTRRNRPMSPKAVDR